MIPKSHLSRSSKSNEMVTVPLALPNATMVCSLIRRHLGSKRIGIFGISTTKTAFRLMNENSIWA